MLIGTIRQAGTVRQICGVWMIAQTDTLGDIVGLSAPIARNSWKIKRIRLLKH